MNDGPFDIDTVINPDSEFQTLLALNDATYPWRVISNDEAGNTADSGVSNFRIDTIPPQPMVLVAPEDGKPTGDSTPLSLWEASTSTADVVDYLLRVAKSGDDIATGPFVLELLVLHPNTGAIPSSALSDDTYSWQVIARDAALNVAASTARTFGVQHCRAHCASVGLPDRPFQ